MLIYFVIFIFITSCCLFEIEEKVTKFLLFWFICIVLVLFAGLRREEASTDYETYLLFFTEIQPGITFHISGNAAEPFYVFIPSFIKLMGMKVVYSFLVYAFLGVLFKGIAILRSTKFVFFSLLIYYSNFFLLHEMTQIRVGVALGLYLLSIKYIVQRKILLFSLIMGLATCFHYSAILLWFTYFIDPNNFDRKKYLIIISLVLPLAMLKFDWLSIFTILPLGVFSQKIDFYYGAMSAGIFGAQINLFNTVTLLNIILCAIFMWKVEILKVRFKYAILFIKMYIMALIVFLFLSFIPPVAFRLKELLEVVQILLIPQLIFLFRERFVGKTLVVIIAFIFFYINVVHLQLVKNYF